SVVDDEHPHGHRTELVAIGVQDDVVAGLAHGRLEVVEQFRVNRQPLRDAAQHAPYDRQGLWLAFQVQADDGRIGGHAGVHQMPSIVLAQTTAWIRAESTGQDSVSSVRRVIERRRILDTCIWETPIRSAIWLWVRSSTKRSVSTWRSRRDSWAAAAPIVI